MEEGDGEYGYLTLTTRSELTQAWPSSKNENGRGMTRFPGVTTELQSKLSMFQIANAATAKMKEKKRELSDEGEQPDSFCDVRKLIEPQACRRRISFANGLLASLVKRSQAARIVVPVTRAPKAT